MIEKEITVNGLEIKYFECGKGKPVFLLHGWGGSKESWEPLLKVLNKNNHHFFCIDLPGFGKSNEPQIAWGVKDYALFFQEFLHKIYVKYQLKEGYDLIVHSFGGRIAITLASGSLNADFDNEKEPELKKLILIAAAGIKPKTTLKMQIGKFLAWGGKKVFEIKIFKKLGEKARKLLYKFLKTHDYEKTSGIMRETFVKVIQEDLKPWIKNIQNPTLIIWGEKDGYVPLSDARYMKEHIKDSQLHTLKEGRHGIHKTHVEEVSKWVNDFLN
jgi:pimeloyl-ACP methyl ester carboxylesterase